MKTLRFEYQYRLDFDDEVYDQQFQLRCIPRDGTHQRVLELDYVIDPIDQVTQLKDGFGNPIYVGSSLEKHRYFSFDVRGVVQCSNEPFEKETACYPIYKFSTVLTKCNDEMKSFCDPYRKMDKEEAAWALNEKVYQLMQYTPYVTNIYTTAIEAFELKQGVCQDYSHILLALLKEIGIPARYVVGMMVGEGATHAWVDAYVEDHWIHLDPTNNREADESYIKLAQGRDYQDCIIDKGFFCGNCNQKLTVHVLVEEIDSIACEEK